MTEDLRGDYLGFSSAVDALEATLDAACTEMAIRRFVHSSRGMETAPFLVATALSGTATRYCLYYRCHAWLLALGGDPTAIVDAITTPNSISPMQPRLPELPVDFISVTVGSQLPVALGLALAGEPVVATFGDGALSTGVVFETLNSAAIHRPDLLFVLDDNNRAVSTPRSRVTNADVGGLCGSLGVDYHRVDAADTDAFGDTIAWLREGGRSPRLLHVLSEGTDPHCLAMSSAHDAT